MNDRCCGRFILLSGASLRFGRFLHERREKEDFCGSYPFCHFARIIHTMVKGRRCFIA